MLQTFLVRCVPGGETYAYSGCRGSYGFSGIRFLFVIGGRFPACGCRIRNQGGRRVTSFVSWRSFYREVKDPERAEWLGQIACRAIIRIGELSRDLEKAEAHGGKIRLPTNGKAKQQVLAEAGLSTSAAQRYEALARRPDVEDYLVDYFAYCRESGPDRKSLRVQDPEQGRAPGCFVRFLGARPLPRQFSQPAR